MTTTPTSPPPNRRVAQAAVDRCNSFAEHHALMGLPDLYSFYCLACDEWHVEEGDAVADQRPNRKTCLAA
jgi:hypothetical protein